MQRLVVLFVLAGLVSAAKLPASFKKCSPKKDDFKQCFQEAVGDAISQLSRGFPEAGLSSLEPVEVPVMTISAGKGTVAVDQNYKDVKLTGFSTMKFDKIEMDLDKKTIYIHGFSSAFKLDGQYSLNGKILLLPIQGEGQATLSLGDTEASLTLNLEEYEKKGAKHYKVVDSKISLEPKVVRFNFENLFNGNKELGDNINKVLNENWKEVYLDVQSGYEQAFAAILQGVANNFFAKVPISQIFDNA